jgi:uncharacterized membrane protein YphA (DoxX/SURF4 family)
MHTRVTPALRVYSGLALAHGWGKLPPSDGFVGRVGGMGLPAPSLFAWLAAVAEFGGELLIALGLRTRPASLLVVAHFIIVVLLAHAGDPFSDRELPLFFLARAWICTRRRGRAGPRHHATSGALPPHRHAAPVPVHYSRRGGCRGEVELASHLDPEEG